MSAAGPQAEVFAHAQLDSGVEFAADILPERNTVAMCFRMLTGINDEPLELTGVGRLAERTLSKGTRRYDGRAFADAFDLLGARWNSASGRQSMLVRVVCLPEFVNDAVELVAEILCRPTFPEEACKVAVELARQDLTQMEDEPQELLGVMIHEITLGAVLGRHPGGTPDSLDRISPDDIREHWRRHYRAGRLQVAVAGAIDADALARHVDDCFAGFGDAAPGGRDDADFTFCPQRRHRAKELEQQYIGVTLPGVSRRDEAYPAELVLLGVLSGGMSGRLFTEVREKQGLVYWVGAWHQHPRGRGIIHLGASTTPERCDRTLQTLLQELRRVGTDLSEEETVRARDGLIAQYETEDDLTRARAIGLSDDLFHFGRPIGRAAKLDALRAVTTQRVADYARRLPLDQCCVATLGPRELP